MTHAAESTHWYRASDGSPAYTVRMANGKERNTTLADARKSSLVPSVTTILKCQDKPALTTWMIDQAIYAALTLPRREGEMEADWIKRVKQDAKEHGRQAAETGTAIHAAIQGHYEGQPPPEEFWPHVKAATKAITEAYGNQVWIPEASFAHPLGFGGKCDLSCNSGPGIVCDFKGKDFTVEEMDGLKTWDEHAQQLAAYRVGLGLPHASCGIVYVSRNVPGLAKFISVPQDELDRGYRMFTALLDYWKAKSKFDPSFSDMPEAA